MIAQNKLFYYDGEVYEKIRTGAFKLSQKEKLAPGKVLKHRKQRYFYRDYLVSIKPIPEEHLRLGLLHLPYDEFLETLENSGIRNYIIIKRKDYLRQVLSGKLAQHWKKYHFKSDEKPDTIQINLDLHNFGFGTFKGELVELFKRFDKYYQEMETKTKNPLVLTYEEDIEADPYVAYNKIKKYLNLRKRKPDIILSKSNIFKNEEVIENYDELKEYLSGTPYEWMVKK
jgi:hypothetical protein